SRREALLIAIAKARQWIDDLAHGRAASFAVIARREGKAERHIRLLAPLAFFSPRIVSALLDATAPADLTLTKLARALPYCWAEQERRDDGDVGRYDQACRHVPAGLVDQEDSVGGGCNGRGDLRKVQVHRFGIAGRQDQGCALAPLRA